MSAIENAARALFEVYRAKVPVLGPWENENEFGQALARDMARAVLMAVREPELDVRVVGRNVILNSGCSPYVDYSVAVGMGFTAMIDAILAKPTE